MKKIVLGVLVLSMLVFVACDKLSVEVKNGLTTVDVKVGEFNQDGTYTGRGPVVTKEYSLVDFDAFEISNDFNVTVTKGEAFSVEVTTNEDVFRYLTVEANGNLLTAKDHEDVVLKNTVVKMTITCPEVSEVSLFNDAIMSMSGDFATDTFNVSLHSDTSLKGNIVANSLSVFQKSDSRLNLSGTVKAIDVEAYSDALVDLSKMEGENADVNLYSDAKCHINVAGKINLTAESSPTLTIYHGELNPISVEEDVIIIKK